MRNPTRRELMAGAAAIPVATVPALPALAETPTQRVQRLCNELSEALDAYDNGGWRAVIHPSRHSEFPIGLQVIAHTKLPDTEPGELRRLVDRYFEQCRQFNALPDTVSDDEADAVADATFNATMRELVGVPARSDDDALAAMEWLVREGRYHMLELDGETPHGRACGWLMRTVRDHLATEARRAQS